MARPGCRQEVELGLGAQRSRSAENYHCGLPGLGPSLSPKVMSPPGLALCFGCASGTAIIKLQDGCNDLFAPLSPGLGAPGLCNLAAPVPNSAAQGHRDGSRMKQGKECSWGSGTGAGGCLLSHQAGLHLLGGRGKADGRAGQKARWAGSSPHRPSEGEAAPGYVRCVKGSPRIHGFPPCPGASGPASEAMEFS